MFGYAVWQCAHASITWSKRCRSMPSSITLRGFPLSMVSSALRGNKTNKLEIVGWWMKRWPVRANTVKFVILFGTAFLTADLGSDASTLRFLVLAVTLFLGVLTSTQDSVLSSVTMEFLGRDVGGSNYANYYHGCGLASLGLAVSYMWFAALAGFPWYFPFPICLALFAEFVLLAYGASLCSHAIENEKAYTDRDPKLAGNQTSHGHTLDKDWGVARVANSRFFRGMLALFGEGSGRECIGIPACRSGSSIAYVSVARFVQSTPPGVKLVPMVAQSGPCYRAWLPGDKSMYLDKAECAKTTDNHANTLSEEFWYCDLYIRRGIQSESNPLYGASHAKVPRATASPANSLNIGGGGIVLSPNIVVPLFGVPDVSHELYELELTGEDVEESEASINAVSQDSGHYAISITGQS